MIKLIVLDLDGTLLSDQKVLSDESVRAIKLAQEKGFLVTIATGRAYELTKPYAERLNITMPLILDNGALIKDPVSKTILFRNTLEPDTIEYFVNYANDNQLGYTFYAEDGFYIKDPERLDFYQKWNQEHPDSLIELHTEFNEESLKERPFYKMLLMIPDYQLMTKTYSMFKDNPKFHITKSLSEFFDVLPHHTTKGTALHFLMERYQLKPEQVLVFGDNTNDLEIFKTAMHSVAMPNATEDLKKVAKSIALADNNNHGVAKTLEYFLTENKLPQSE